MAKTYTQTDFDKLMKRVKLFYVRVKNYLELVKYEKWARLYAPVPRGWVMTSNIAECINSTLVAARELPIFDILEQVRLMFLDGIAQIEKMHHAHSHCLGRSFKRCFCLMNQNRGV